ncbi:uncharacterized protein LOC141910646 [Tubulanus polymorphus]|uniref:uncharacterized protein LOC141910646 n=1 Tax=Tubulanus polymorphus TaxID=672921 RepID=UPI003DA5AE82
MATKIEAIWGMLVADSLSMPVHWFYRPPDIKRLYNGWITTYRPPCIRHPSCILSLSATDGSGRHGASKPSAPIIGNIILHDKLKYWQSNDRGTHYHQGMAAGDSTLNSLCSLRVLQTLRRVDAAGQNPSAETRAAVMADYVEFMTTPGTHNDTYAESFHRLFFKDWSMCSSPPKAAAELLTFAETRSNDMLGKPEDGQLPSIGAFVMAVPWIVHYSHLEENECVKNVVDFVKLTHPVKTLVPYLEAYARMLRDVCNGKNLKDSITQVLSSGLYDQTVTKKIINYNKMVLEFETGSEEQIEAYQEAVADLGLPCYIKGAMSSMLLLALTFHDNCEAGLLMNANVGGECCHRGAALGALLGAAAGQTTGVPDHLKQALGTGGKMYASILAASSS